MIFSKLKNNNFFKKIFNIRRSPKKHNKTMEKIADFLHGSLLFSSVFLFYLFFLDEKILNISLNIPIFLFFSANLYLIHKFSGKDFLQPKPIQRTISHFLNKYSIFLFIIHWIFLSFWAGAGIFVLTTFLAINYIYAVDFLRARPTFDRASFSYSYNHSYNQSSYIYEDFDLNRFFLLCKTYGANGKEAILIAISLKQLTKKSFKIISVEDNKETWFNKTDINLLTLSSASIES